MSKTSSEQNAAILYSRVWRGTKAFIVSEQKRLKHRSLAAYLNNHFGEKKRKRASTKK